MAFVLTTVERRALPEPAARSPPSGQAKLTCRACAGAPPGRHQRQVGGRVHQSPTSNSTKQCSTVTSATGAAGKLKVGTARGWPSTRWPAPPTARSPGLSASAGQTKLKAV